MHHSRATKLHVCIQVTNWAINHAVPQRSYCQGAGISLCVPHFHFLPCGAPPFSVSLHNHSLSLCVTVNLVRPIADFSSLSRCPCSVISLMLGHFAPSLSLYSLAHWLNPHLFFKHSNNPILYLLLLLSFHPVFLQHSLHLCVTQQHIIDVYLRYNQRQTVRLRGHLSLDAYVLHTCVCVDLCPVQSWISSFYALKKREQGLHSLIWYQPWHWFAGFKTEDKPISWGKKIKVSIRNAGYRSSVV